jgi:hypothetical protein
MSKGSPIIPNQFPPELLARVGDEVALAERTRSAEPWTRSSFVLAAVRAFLDKRERSRKQGGKRKKGKCTTRPQVMSLGPCR